MRDSVGNDTPLDRTTARVVAELASRIIPELTQAVEASEAERSLTLTNSMVAAFGELSSLKELCSGLAGSIEASRAALQPMLGEALARIEAKLPALDRLEKQMRDSADEGRTSRQVMLQPLGAIADELSIFRAQTVSMSDALKGVKAQEETLQKLSDAVSRLNDSCMEAAARQAEMSKSMAELDRQRKEQPPASQPVNDGKLPQLLATALPNWEGLLRAHTQAQTRELDSLSQELGTLHRQTNEAMLQNLQDAMAQEFAEHEEELEERMKAERAEIERSIASLRRSALFLAGMGIVSLALSVAMFVRLLH